MSDTESNTAVEVTTAIQMALKQTYRIMRDLLNGALEPQQTLQELMMVGNEMARVEPADAFVMQRAFNLTKREWQVLRLVADGKSNREAANELWVTEQTVKFHLTNVFLKLEVKSRTEAGAWYHRTIGQRASSQRKPAA